MGLHGRAGRIARETTLRRGGEEIGHAVLERDELRLRVVAGGRVVGGEPARVVEQRRHVVRPQAPECGRGLVTEERPHDRGQVVGVSGDCGVRGLPEVVVVADAAAHQVRGEHGVLAKQCLELQRLVRGRLAGRRAQGTGGAGLRAHPVRGRRRGGRPLARRRRRRRARRWRPGTSRQQHAAQHHDRPPALARRPRHSTSPSDRSSADAAPPPPRVALTCTIFGGTLRPGAREGYRSTSRCAVRAGPGHSTSARCQRWLDSNDASRVGPTPTGAISGPARAARTGSA